MSRAAARPHHVLVGSLAAGLALALAPDWLAPAAAAAVAGAVLLADRAGRRTESGGRPPYGAAAEAGAATAKAHAPALAVLAAALVLAGAAAGDARLGAIEESAARVEGGAVHGLRVHLVSRPRPSAFGSSAEAEVEGGRLEGARLLVRIPRWTHMPRPVEPGDELTVSGRIREPRRADAPDSFDFAAYLRRRGLAAELLLDSARAGGGRRGGLDGLLDRMRRRAESGVAAGLPAPAAALARGMVLGQDEEIDGATRQDWRDSGLAHLLAVSGQNVMLLVALALPLLALARVAPLWRGLALLVLVALYVPLAGAGPSLQRAGVMGAAGIAAMMLSRPGSRWYALLLAAAATLALNPRAAADPGWQLSFAAVAGILTVGRRLAEALARSGAQLLRDPARPAARALTRGLAEAVAITVAATLATAPLVAFHFDSVPLAGLLANLLALPAVAPAMWLGMVKAALGLAGAALPPAQALAGALGPLVELPLDFLDGVAERCADLPGAQLRLPLDSPAAVCAVYAGFALALAAGPRVRRPRRRSGPSFAERAAGWRRAPRTLRAGVALVLAASVALGAASGLGAPAPPDRLTVRFLDVGQGDATLIQHPDGSTMLFDGGPPEGGIERLLRRAGVRRLAAVVATHASRDHHGGLVDVLRRYPVALLLDGGDGNPDPALAEVREEAARRGVRRVPAVAPMTLRLGALSVRVLSPPPRPPGPAPEDPNPRAVVAVVSAGAFDLFLSADAESDALLPLDLPEVEAMKVPHHGSADPGLGRVLERLRPQLAAIEVGPNTYGHPAPSTLAALRRADVTTYRTDRDGTVTLSVSAGRMLVETEG